VQSITFSITVRGWSAGHAHAVDRTPETRSGTEPRFPTKPYVISTGAVFGLDAINIDGSWQALLGRRGTDNIRLVVLAFGPRHIYDLPPGRRGQ
jgi:hypothetical protein